MNGTHPKLNGVAVVATVVALLGCCGCRTPSGSLASNPLMGPDRVPPPATRALQPGEAKPYYPGDPVPAMQGNNAAPEAAPMTAGFAWTAPNKEGAAPATSSPPAPPSAPGAPAFTATTPAMNERAVVIPTDQSALRFQPTTPVAAQPVVSVSNQRTVNEQQTVTPTAYYEPVASSPPATPMWQKPQIAPTQPTSPPTVQPQHGSTPSQFATMSQSQTSLPALPPPPPQPSYIAQTPMDVSLRAVPSPPPAPGEYSTPRIRLPGYQPTEPVPIAGSNDGFRTRTSMR